MTTRSSTLWVTTLQGKLSGILYTSPGNTVTLVKDILAETYSFPNTVTFYVFRQGAAGVTLTRFSTTGTTPLFAQWQGWVVLEPGDYVQVNWDNGAVATWGSGALLPVGST